MGLKDTFRHSPSDGDIRLSRSQGSRRRFTEKRGGDRDLKRGLLRRSLLEGLEQRQLMAAGPRLLGVEPNNGNLLVDGAVLTTSPSELILRFADTSQLDVNTLGAIRITRAGSDGFALARAATDFGTEGLVIVEFIATASGTAGNGTILNFTTADRGPTSSRPGITVTGSTVAIEINSNPNAVTRVSDLLTAINTGPAAALINANLLQGPDFARIDQRIPAAGLNVTLIGADRPQVATDLAATGVQVRIAARATGSAGQGITINVRRFDLGVGGRALIESVNGKTINVLINSNPLSRTTVTQFVEALRNNPAVDALVETRLESGNANAFVGNPDLFAPIQLSAGSALADEVITPGFVGLGDSPGEVVVRFSQPLPQDVYRLEVLGAGPDPLKNVNGDRFNMGTDVALTFTLNRAPQVLAVVPQPIVTTGGVRSQRNNEIWVYFDRNDPLDTATATTPGLYRLYATRRTALGSDDAEFVPTNVTYNRDSGIAILRFASDFSTLVGGGFKESFRLQIGGHSIRPSVPIATAIPGNASSTLSFPVADSQLDLVAVTPGQTYTVNLSVGNIPSVTLSNATEINVVTIPGQTAAEVAALINNNGIIGPLLRATIGGSINAVIDGSLLPASRSVTQARSSITLTRVPNGTGDLLVEPAIEGTTVSVSFQESQRAEVTVGVNTVTINVAVGQTFGEVVNLVNNNPAARALVKLTATGDPNARLIPTSRNAQLFEVGGLLANAFDLSPTLNLNGNNIRSLTVRGEISNRAANEFLIDYPGASNEEGNRFLRAEDPGRLTRSVPLDHLRAGADSIDGVQEIEYNFAGSYLGDDPATREVLFNKTYFNQITESQKNRVREVLDLYSQYLGVQFVETAAMGIQIAVGDLFGADPSASSGEGGLAVVTGVTETGAARRLGVLDFQDFDESDADEFGGRFTRGAMLLVGQLLGYGYADELEQALNNGAAVSLPRAAEQLFPGLPDIVHGQHLHRPDSIDVDLYRLTIPSGGGVVTIETVAERLSEVSRLDTHLRLFRELGNGTLEPVAANDDYWSEDSHIELTLAGGNYFIGVSASGNSEYDPMNPRTGAGGRSEGVYELRISFTPRQINAIQDSSGLALDGDADGNPGGAYNFWFDAAPINRTFFVDKNATVNGTGSLGAPFNTISAALSAAAAVGGSVVRILANGGADGRLETAADNLPYLIGFSESGVPLADGADFQIPANVTVMIDAGTIIKLRRARIGVGSVSATVNRSGAAIQLLGTPLYAAANGSRIAGDAVTGSVILTSLADRTVGGTQSLNPVRAGDWGGIDIRNDVDRNDENRVNLEALGIFPNVVQWADIRYGGGVVLVNGRPEVISPVEMSHSRPLVAYSTITFSADSAIEGTANSFEETRFSQHAQQAGADYVRLGPDLRGNRLTNNSVNAVFIRTVTRDGSGLEPLTVNARLHNRDVVHVLGENMLIKGTPGGSLVESEGPAVLLVRLTPGPGLIPAGTYEYRLTFVDANGNESPASDPTQRIVLPVNGGVRLSQLPSAPAGFVARRLYRALVSTDSATGAVTVGQYRLAAEINAVSSEVLDSGQLTGRVLDTPALKRRARLDARLSIDPGLVIKAAGSVIELGLGTQLIAEGAPGQSIIITSLDDRRYGAGGTFDTNTAGGGLGFNPGDWGGIYVGPGASASLDHVRLIGAGGAARIEGRLAGFNPLEVHQGQLRLTNSRIEQSADGVPEITGTRNGRGAHAPAAIFARGSQPIVVGNTFINNASPALSFDLSSLDASYVNDYGRSTGNLGRIIDAPNNQGPLVANNVLQNNLINGLEVRPGRLATEGVWDDTDMVHVVRGQIEIPNQHVYGGLRLQSSPRQSLVVKFANSQDANGNTVPAGIVVGGTLASAAAEFQDIATRIGGSLQIIGQPGKPVILTGLQDDTIGSGFDTLGQPVTDTSNDGLGGNSLLPTGPEVNNGLLIDNDVPVNTPGFFQALPQAGGALATSGVTAQGLNNLFVNQDFVFSFLNFIDVGSDGGAISLANTTITTPPTLAGEDLVISEGNFPGANGLVRWRVETRFDDGVARAFNTLTLTSDLPIGNLRFINYLDEDIQAISDDFLFTTGIPGQDNFRAFTLDGPERIGFAQGGFFVQGPELQGATYTGWAADRFNDLQAAILGPGTNYSLLGNIDTVDLPPFTDPALGQAYGPADITTAFAWNVQPEATFARITSFLELIPDDPQQVPSGQWQGITIREGASDRNYGISVESEGGGVGEGRRNDTASRAQFLGEIAPSIPFGSENRRLGFRVRGTIETPSDVDVYSFKAEAGTEVWLDIDRTHSALDSVVQLIAIDGSILASSDDSVAEEEKPSLLVNGGIDAGRANPLRKGPRLLTSRSAFGTAQDLFSINRNDAGMRVVLPGETGQVSTYHVAVRSRNAITRGAYELNVRVREVDEAPGTVIHLADIRFATTGITLIGQPLHSPLLGEEAEQTAANGLRSQAQVLGNFGVVSDTTVQNPQAGPLNSDRLATTIAGNLANAGDVDWYQFTIGYDRLTRDNLSYYLSTIFDVDYVDGFARPDLSIWVYDSNGNLILSGLDSNIADDQPGSLRGTDATDLSRGSAGNLDPYIGSVELREGTYFLAVSARDTVPVEFNQFFSATTVNPLIRLEPLESIQRIVEDRIGGPLTSATTPPVQPILWDRQNLGTPFTLNDLSLYVNIGSSVFLVNPFTGQRYEQTNGTLAAGQLGTTPNTLINDIAFRFNGDLHGYLFDATQGDDGLQYVGINTGDASLTNLTPGGTNLTTAHDFVVEVNAIQILDVNSNDGFVVEGLAFADFGNVERAFVVGNRPIGRAGLAYTDNVLLEVDPATGNFLGPNINPILLGNSGAGIGQREKGRIVTSSPPNAPHFRLGVTDATGINSAGVIVPQILDGSQFTIRDFQAGNTAVYELDAGAEVTFSADVANGIFLRDGDQIIVGNLGSEVIFEIDSGPRISLNNPRLPGGVTDGATVRLSGPSGAVATFEFDNNQRFAVGNIQVPFLQTDSEGAAAIALANAINAANIGVIAQASPTGEVVLRGLTAQPTVVGGGVLVRGSLGVALGNRPIVIDEIFGPNEIAATVARAFVAAGFDAVQFGPRVNLVSGPPIQLALQTPGIVAPGAVVTGRIGQQVSGSILIPFRSDDTFSEIAQRIRAAIAADSRIGGVTVTVDGKTLVINGGQFLNPTAPFVLGGLAPPFRDPAGNPIPGEPIIRGIAPANGNLYAVSETGGLFQILNTELGGVNSGRAGNIGSYVQTATDLIGIQFTGLTKGPPFAQGGIYQNLLFGIDRAGVIYAFNTRGELQPVFAGGRSSIPTGLNGASGLDFSILDYNLWHISNLRGSDPGHGVNATPNGTRLASEGGSSLYFGFEGGIRPFSTVSNPAVAPRYDQSTINRSYNFPGGAHGEILSNPFDLIGFSRADQPTLYFTYLLNTEDSAASGVDDNTIVSDALRVYLVTEEGVEYALATNNSGRSGGSGDDEFDDPSNYGGVYSQTYNDARVPETQELFDNTGAIGSAIPWRQVRVPLGEFAGLRNLRLRIEFSTAGSMAFHSANLTAVPGSAIRDGDTFVVNNRTFEFVTDPTLSLPSGTTLGIGPHQVIIDNVKYVLFTNAATVPPPDNANQRVVAIPYAQTETGQVIAQRMAAAVQGFSETENNKVIDPDANENAVNDTIATATTITLFGGQHSILSALSNIGASANPRSRDVDLYRLDLTRGQRIDATVVSVAGINPLTSVLRLFDREGLEVARGTANLDGNRQLGFVAPNDGTYYLGISGEGNDSYNPLIAPAVGEPNARVPGDAGLYQLQLFSRRAYDIRTSAAEVILTGTGTITLPANTPLRLTGGDGFVGIPVQINLGMTASQVATQIVGALNANLTGLSNSFFATGPNIRLEGAVVNRVGPLRQLVRSGDAFARPTVEAARNNSFEGIFLDDFIIGFAERGEMVTGTIGLDTFAASSRPALTNPPLQPQPTTSGPYQVEIRDGAEYVQTSSQRANILPVSTFRGFDTNDRLNSQATIIPGSGAQLRELHNRLLASNPNARLTFDISDGLNKITFEFVDLSRLGNNATIADAERAAQQGNVAVPYNSARINSAGRPVPDSRAEVAASLLNAILKPSVQALLKVRALSSSGLGPNELASLGDDRINLYGANVVLEDAVLEDRADRRIISFEEIAADEAGVPAPFAIAVRQIASRGDQNRARDSQGVIIIDGASIQFSSEFGVRIDHGLGGTGGNQPNVMRYPRNLTVQNTQNLVPGVVVQNSRIAYNARGGIQIEGAANDATIHNPLPFDRLVNNTIVGGSVREGISGVPVFCDGTLFPSGAISFADLVVSYNPNAGGLPPQTAFQTPQAALGTPDFALLSEPTAANQGAVSLGRGGTLTVQFVNNRLTGSGDLRPDLKVFEVGLAEPVLVEVSADGVNFTPVGTVVGGANTLDIDAFGFGPTDRLAFVRVRDVGFSNSADLTAGGDIDAIGAITTVPAEVYAAGGVGVSLVNGTSPTLLNNVLVNHATAIQSDNLARTSVVAGNTYQLNTNNTNGPVTTGNLAQFVGPLNDLFVSASRSLFTPGKGSRIIDNSVDSLQDRPELVVVKAPIGLPNSPVLAPDLDGNGTFRVDDPTVEVTGGFGASLFKDRGALDRGDLAPPRATISVPTDQGPNDLNPQLDLVQVVTATNRFFEIRLADGGEPADADGGVGIDDRTVTSDVLLILRNNVPLVEGIDYRFSYDANSDTIRLTPVAGLWETDVVYKISMVTSTQSVLLGLDPNGYADGDRFLITDLRGVTRTFEIDTGIILRVGDLGGGRSGLIDGDTITVFDGTNQAVFEVDILPPNSTVSNGVRSGNIRVSIRRDATLAQAGLALAEALATSTLNLQVINVGDGRIQLHSANRLVSVQSSTLLLTTTGSTGVDPGFGIAIPSVRNVATTVLDGQQFTIRRGDGRQQLFEMTTDNSVAQGAIPVFFVSNSSPGVIAESIAQAIRTATLDLLPVVDPTGVVLLPNAADVSLLLGNSVFTQVGRSGQTASIRVPLPLNATSLEWTVALESAIDAQNIAGVGTQVVGNRILISGTRAVSGTGSVLLTAPSDLAGNRLAGNPSSGSAEFEIRLSRGLDYGDAPNVSSSSVNGPTHRIADGLSLGPTVTPDANAPTSDLDDGVIFASPNRIFAGTGLGYTVNVRNLEPTRTVVLNAWFDWNGNGVFEASGREHVVINAPVNAGNNSFSALVPLDAKRGTIQARFRLSSQTGLGPMGPAVDGEVEDYSVTVRSNPFQNGVNFLDVDGNGRVNPVDALLVINRLNAGNVILDFNTAADPPVPPFWDVTGNGRIEPSDVLPIINFLNSLAQSEPTVFGVAGPGVLAPMAQIARDTRTPQVDLTNAYELRTAALRQASGEPQEDYSELAFAWNDQDEDKVSDEKHAELDDFFTSLT